MNEYHLKDEKSINNKTCEKKNLQILSKKCDEAVKSSNPQEYLKNELLKKGTQESKKTNPKHTKCEGCNSGRRTEKRTCRCMYYYNKKECEKDCEACKLNGKKWKNIGDIKVNNYEMPMPYVIEGVGGIDLILEYNNEEYGTEVKPWSSSETISRMVAETLTYNLDGKYKPAIAVFEKNIDTGKETYQYKTINEYKDTDVWEKIKNYGVEIFAIRVWKKESVTEFSIEPLN